MAVKKKEALKREIDGMNWQSIKECEFVLGLLIHCTDRDVSSRIELIRHNLSYTRNHLRGLLEAADRDGLYKIVESEV